MSLLQRLHTLALQQKSALDAGDLDGFQELLFQRMHVQTQIGTISREAALHEGRLLADIVAVDNDINDILREMATTTSARLAQLVHGKRALHAYCPTFRPSPEFADDAI